MSSAVIDSRTSLRDASRFEIAPSPAPLVLELTQKRRCTGTATSQWHCPLIGRLRHVRITQSLVAAGRPLLLPYCDNVASATAFAKRVVHPSASCTDGTSSRKVRGWSPSYLAPRGSGCGRSGRRRSSPHCPVPAARVALGVVIKEGDFAHVAAGGRARGKKALVVIAVLQSRCRGVTELADAGCRWCRMRRPRRCNPS